MNNLLQQVGKYCPKGHQIQVLRSAAGYYIGTVDEEGPYCRISGYGSSADDPAMNEERICAENQYCNGGSISGCRVSATECIKHGVPIDIGGKSC